MTEAINTVLMAWPGMVGLAIGALVRFFFDVVDMLRDGR